MPKVAIGWETDWGTFWAEGKALARAEHSEILLHDPRPELFRPDEQMLEKLHSMGLLLVASARIDGRLMGFLSWTREQNVESRGAHLVRMGATYVKPEAAGLRLGVKLFRFSLEAFKVSLAPIRVICHHPPEGRGSKLAGLFAHLGLVKSSVEYSTFLSSSRSSLDA